MEADLLELVRLNLIELRYTNEGTPVIYHIATDRFHSLLDLHHLTS